MMIRLADALRAKRGFTLLEMIITIAIIAVLYTTVYGRIGGILSQAQTSRANAELSEIAKATYQYVVDHDGEWPADMNRGIPPGIEDFLGPGEWPDGPWPGSEYDWDNYIASDGNPAYQISIRFCPLGNPNGCMFPDEEWAENFDYYSGYYYCIQGRCRANSGKPDNHPGYCVNCLNEE